MIYYKTTPPKLMIKAFKASQLAAQRHGGQEEQQKTKEVRM